MQFELGGIVLHLLPCPCDIMESKTNGGYAGVRKMQDESNRYPSSKTNKIGIDQNMKADESNQYPPWNKCTGKNAMG